MNNRTHIGHIWFVYGTTYEFVVRLETINEMRRKTKKRTSSVLCPRTLVNFPMSISSYIQYIFYICVFFHLVYFVYSYIPVFCSCVCFDVSLYCDGLFWKRVFSICTNTFRKWHANNSSILKLGCTGKWFFTARSPWCIVQSIYGLIETMDLWHVHVQTS